MKVDAYLEPDVVEEPKPEVVDKPDSESEGKDPFIRTHVDLPAEPTIKLSLSAMGILLSLRSSYVYHPLQIFLKVICSQEVGFLIVQSTIEVFSRDNLFRHATCALFEIPSTTAGGSWKPVPTPPPWLSHDASVLIFRPPP